MALKIPFRYVIALLVCMSTAVDYMSRTNMNVAIVSMVRPKNKSDGESAFGACPYKEGPANSSTNSSDINHYDDRFDWDAKLQGIILGAFYYCYIFLNVPLGRMSELYGGKWIVASSLLLSGLMNLITPLVAHSPVTLIATRILLGIAQGGVFPASFGLIANWFPVKERSFAFTMITFGATVGHVSGNALAGIMSDHGGWQGSFYWTGVISIVAFIIFTPFGQSHPEDSRFVSSEELEHIRKGQENGRKINSSKPSVPWLSILTSRPVLVLGVAKFGHAYTGFIISSKLPAYLNDVLHVSPTMNGVITAMLYTTTAVFVLMSGQLSEMVITRGWLSRTNSRKVFFSIASFGSGLCLALVPFIGCNHYAVICLLLISNASLGFTSGGIIPVSSELTQHFPSTLFGIMNTLSTVQGIIAPYIAGVILDSNLSDSLMDLWSYVLFTGAAVTTIAGLTFAVFGQAKRQKWDYFEGDEDLEGLSTVSEEDLNKNRNKDN